MRKKGIISKILLFLTIGLIFSSCKSKETFIDYDDSLKTAEIVGELKHKQYWNKHDKWDVSGIELQIFYEDGHDSIIPITDNHIYFEYIPEIPADNVSELIIHNGSYTNNNGKRIYFNDKKFDVTIIDYPYSEEISFQTNVFYSALIVIPLTTIFLLFSFFVFKKDDRSDNLKE